MSRFVWMLSLMMATGAVHAQYALTNAGYDSAAEGPGYADRESAGIGDVNGDGRDDLVWLDAWFRVGVRLQRRDGTLAEPIRRYFVSDRCPGQTWCDEYTRSWIRSMLVADFDGDGRDEILVPRNGGMSILKVAPHGAARMTLYEYTGFNDVVIGYPNIMDVDGDGHRDIVGFMPDLDTPATKDMAVLTYYGDGHGGIRGHSTVPAGGLGVITDSTVADINGDGLKDLAFSVMRSTVPMTGAIGVLYRSPAGGFAAPVWFDPGLVPMAIAAIDFDRDSRVDLVTAVMGMTTSLALLKQATDATFAVSAYKPTYHNPTNMRVTDLNKDGKDDLILLHDGWPAVTYYIQGISALGAEQGIQFPAGAPTVWNDALAVGDLNGDHCPDAAIAVGNRGLYWMVGSGCWQYPDLLASVGLTPTNVAVRIDNMGTLAAGNTAFTVDIKVRSGTLTSIDAPPGCFKTILGNTNRFGCSVGIVLAGTARTMVFGIGTDPGPHNTVEALVIASTETPESSLVNNRAWKQVAVRATPKRLPAPSIRSKQKAPADN